MHFKKVFMLVFSIFILTEAFSTASYSLGISAGVSTWYTWWELDQNGEDGKIDMGDTLMYGPMVALRFSPQWSLSSAFLYGKFENSSDSDGPPEEIKRYDSDTALNYSLNKYFRIFAGFKFMGYKFKGGKNNGYGPGIGIGIVLPVTEQFIIMGSFSGLYQWGTEEDDENGVTYESDVTSKGFNTSLALAYYIPAASVTLSAGFRYQYLEMEIDETYKNRTKNMDHTFYGFTFSAAYSLEL